MITDFVKNDQYTVTTVIFGTKLGFFCCCFFAVLPLYTTTTWIIGQIYVNNQYVIEVQNFCCNSREKCINYFRIAAIFIHSFSFSQALLFPRRPKSLSLYKDPWILFYSAQHSASASACVNFFHDQFFYSFFFLMQKWYCKIMLIYLRHAKLYFHMIKCRGG